METFKYKINFKGYIYTVKYNSINYFTWKCSTKNTTDCPTILKASISRTNPSVLCVNIT